MKLQVFLKKGYFKAQSEIEKIISNTESGSLGRKQQLEVLLKQLGCSEQGLGDARTIQFDENEAIRRILESARSGREASLWLVALVSSIASVLSALAAWLAVMSQCR